MKTLTFILTITILTGYSLGQSAQATGAALLRTFMIGTNFGRGTTFSIDVDNREYWITAKHIFTGIKTGPAGEFRTQKVEANILSQIGEGDEGHDQHWMTETFTVIDPGKDIDILVLVPDHLLLDQPGAVTLKTGNTVGIGGECEFLGFPYGGGWKTRIQETKDPTKSDWVWLPYVKHCTPSARSQEKGLGIWILDGINNEGFSGGPVLYGTGADQRVFAVIAGFHQEALDVLPAPKPGERLTSNIPASPKLPGAKSKKPKNQIVNANSGFIVAFDLDPAIKAIQNNPVGPIRQEANSR